MKWLIEPEVFEDQLKDLIAGLEYVGTPYVACKFGKSYEEYAKELADEEELVFHGSFQFAEAVNKFKPNWKGFFFNLPKFDCRYYYPKFGEYLLNRWYIMLPFGDLQRRRDDLFGFFDHIRLFVRPAAGNKIFTGKVIELVSWEQELKKIEFYGCVEPDELIVIAPGYEDISKEWRIVVVDKQIIGCCRYRKGPDFSRVDELPTSVLKFVQKVLEEVDYNPDRAWMLDICQTGKKCWVLEVGPFSCCSIYKANPEPIIRAINQAVCN